MKADVERYMINRRPARRNRKKTKAVKKRKSKTEITICCDDQMISFLSQGILAGKMDFFKQAGLCSGEKRDFCINEQNLYQKQYKLHTGTPIN